MTSEFKENNIEEIAKKETEKEVEYETEEEVEYKNEEETESKTKENQVINDTETKQQIKKNIKCEVEQKETNTKKRSWMWKKYVGNG
ncbi:unnamed protein product [Rhizophagus irregularis]|nr:unnamed protein product [Rhizophagus irregularis]